MCTIDILMVINNNLIIEKKKKKIKCTRDHTKYPQHFPTCFKKNSQYEVNCQKYPKLKLITNYSTQMECLFAYSYTIYIHNVADSGNRGGVK